MISGNLYKQPVPAHRDNVCIYITSNHFVYISTYTYLFPSGFYFIKEILPFANK